jgi:hypothetical protein
VAGLPAAVAGEIGVACGMHAFIPGMSAGGIFLGPDDTPGSSFTAVADGLQGVSVWLEGRIGNGVMVLRAMEADDRPGEVVARAPVTSVDTHGLAVFGFDPIADSAGKRYRFAIECPGCFEEAEPQVLAARSVLRQGNLTVNGVPNPEHTLAFAPAYERPAPRRSA